MNLRSALSCCALAAALGCHSFGAPRSAPPACPALVSEDFRALDAARVTSVARACARRGHPDLAARAYLAAGRIREASRILEAAPRVRVAADAVPVYGTSGSIPLVEVSVGGHSGLMIWNTAAQATAFDPAFLRSIGAEDVDGAGVVLATSRARWRGALVYVPAVRIGPFDVDQLFAASIDLAAWRALDERIVGIVGADVWSAFRFSLDMERRALRVGAGVELPPPGAELAAQRNRGRFAVSGHVNGQAVEFLLDTAATTTAVSDDVFRRLGADADAVRWLDRDRIDASGRRAARTGALATERIELGHHVELDRSVLVDAPTRLGLDVLGSGTLVIDAGQGRVYLQR